LPLTLPNALEQAETEEKKMAGRGFGKKPPAEGDKAALRLPETQTNVLARAAAGDWTEFLGQYLQPCWREVVLACRAKNIPLDDAEDLFQELLLRLVRVSGGSRRTGDVGNVPQANLPGRYLASRNQPLGSARFRTYLKATIRNLIREAARKSRRSPANVSPTDWQLHEPYVVDTVTQWIERQWLHDAAHEAARRFRAECRAARTRGKRRLFELLYLVRVRECSPDALAKAFGLDASTVSALLRQAQGRFGQWLQQTTGIQDDAELLRLLSGQSQLLRDSLAQAHAPDA
jgi:DNA-directed RNA polymerase specialized sigma24 family protein